VVAVSLKKRALRQLGINTTVRATTEHGLTKLWPPVGNDFATGTVGPKTGLASLVAGFPHADLEVFLEALAENHYVQVLAEPNLTAASGEEANFLAGGEFPIPVVQGGAGGTSTAISIEYKEYGVALQFVPVVLGNNSIRLHVGTEVSRLSLKGAVVIEGFRVPASRTPRRSTRVSRGWVTCRCSARCSGRCSMNGVKRSWSSWFVHRSWNHCPPTLPRHCLGHCTSRQRTGSFTVRVVWKARRRQTCCCPTPRGARSWVSSGCEVRERGHGTTAPASRADRRSSSRRPPHPPRKTTRRARSRQRRRRALLQTEGGMRT
jgi:hypothetical protein